MPCGGGREAKLSLPLGGDTSTSCARNVLCIAAALEVDLFPYKLRCLFLGIITTYFKCIQHYRKFYSHTLAMMDKFVLACFKWNLVAWGAMIGRVDSTNTMLRRIPYLQSHQAWCRTLPRGSPPVLLWPDQSIWAHCQILPPFCIAASATEALHAVPRPPYDVIW